MKRRLMALAAVPLTILPWLAFSPVAGAATLGAATGAEAGASAGAATVPVSSVGAGMAGQLTQLVLGLLVVLAVIVALAWLLRRVQQIKPRGGQVIDIISARALGPRDRLVLVQVGDEQILLGISPGRINSLHVMQHPVRTPDKTEQATPEFAQRLMELLGKDQKDKK